MLAASTSSMPESKRIGGSAPWVFQPMTKRQELTSSEHLCHSCRTIDFVRIFNLSTNDLPRTGRAVFRIGTLENIRARARESCSLCCMFECMIASGLVSGSFETRRVNSVWHLRALTSLCMLRLSSSKGNSRTTPSIVLGLVDSQPNPRLNPKSLRECLGRGVILPNVNARTCQLGGSLAAFGRTPIEPVNYDWINEAIEECKAEHQLCRNELHPSSAAVEVIDCKARQVVPLQQGFDYYALSYVWGKEQTGTPCSQRLSSRNLPKILPQTVEDAITVTLGTGRRYLWVDMYCIDQHNAEEKKIQINEMANIYQAATATIVALGPGANAGLGRISYQKEAQFVVDLGEQVLFWSGPSLEYCLSVSQWSTRAWTYQEAFLSSRCLFFTPWNVFHACVSAIVGDRVLQAKGQELFDLCGQERPCLEPGLFDRSRRTGTPDIDLFNRHLRGYTSRDLTKESDRFDAFKGLLSRCGWKTIWAIPIVNEPTILRPGTVSTKTSLLENAGFACGMLWKVVEPVHANVRTGFPSWSWLSRCGETVILCSYRKNKFKGRLSKGLGQTRSTAGFEVDLLGGPLRSLSDVPEACLAHQISPVLRVSSTMLKWSLTSPSMATEPSITITYSMHRKDVSGYTHTKDRRWIKGLLFPDEKISYGDQSDTIGSCGLAVFLLDTTDRSWWLAVRQTAMEWRRTGLISCESLEDDILSQRISTTEERKTVFLLG